MNNTHKSKEPSKKEKGLHFCNWAAMGAELQPKNSQIFQLQQKSSKPL